MSTGPPNVNDLLGPFVLQGYFAFALFGISLVQARTYFENCSSDPRVLVVAVALLYVLQYFYVFTLGHVSYTFTVTRFGDYGKLTIPPWSFCIGAVIIGTFTLVVQLYYARQVYVLGQKKKILPATILLLSVTSFAFTVASTIKGYSYGDFRRFDEFIYGVLIWLCTAAAADVLITVSLVYYLRAHRRESHFADTRSMLSRVIANTIENNALTCVVASVDAVLFSQLERVGSWHVVCNGVLVGLYFVSLLTALNARHRFAARRELVRHLDLSPSASIMQMPISLSRDDSGAEPSTAGATAAGSVPSSGRKERSSSMISGSGATVTFIRAMRRPSTATSNAGSGPMSMFDVLDIDNDKAIDEEEAVGGGARTRAA